jgi:hypothetical protein
MVREYDEYHAKKYAKIAEKEETNENREELYGRPSGADLALFDARKAAAAAKQIVPPGAVLSDALKLKRGTGKGGGRRIKKTVKRRLRKTVKRRRSKNRIIG